MIPDHWAELPLEEACSLVTDGTHHSPPNGPTGSYRYVTAKNVRPWGLDLSDITWVSESVHREIYARCPVEHGDVLYIKDGVTTGLAAVNHLRDPFSLLSSVALLKPRREMLNPSYLKHWLNSPETYSKMTADMTGSAIQRLVLRQIRGALMPVPPLAEQKRIADKLDTLLARMDACRQRLDRVPAILKRFRQSVLASATSGELTREWREERGKSGEWPKIALGTLLVDVRYGTAKKCWYEPKAIPVLRIPNVASGSIDHEDLKFAKFDENERSKLELLPGDLLVIRSNGSLGLVGRTAVVSERESGFLYAGYLIRLRPHSGRVRSAYLALCLESPNVRSMIEQMARSTTGVNNINAEEIRRLPVRLPSVDEQDEIVRRTGDLLGALGVLEVRTSAGGLLERVVQAALAKAFRGELVPQDPNDEPASALLERLRAESSAKAETELAKPSKRKGRLASRQKRAS